MISPVSPMRFGMAQIRFDQPDPEEDREIGLTFLRTRDHQDATTGIMDQTLSHHAAVLKRPWWRRWGARDVIRQTTITTPPQWQGVWSTLLNPGDAGFLYKLRKTAREDWKAQQAQAKKALAPQSQPPGSVVTLTGDLDEEGPLLTPAMRLFDPQHLGIHPQIGTPSAPKLGTILTPDEIAFTCAQPPGTITGKDLSLWRATTGRWRNKRLKFPRPWENGRFDTSKFWDLSQRTSEVFHPDVIESFPPPSITGDDVDSANVTVMIGGKIVNLRIHPGQVLVHPGPVYYADLPKVPPLPTKPPETK